MHQEYKDDPRKIEGYLNRLSDRDRAMVDFGYLLAIEGFLEQISDSKRKLYLRLLGEKEPEVLERLGSKLLLLEIFERHYEKRAKVLSNDRTLQAICWPVYT